MRLLKFVFILTIFFVPCAYAVKPNQKVVPNYQKKTSKGGKGRLIVLDPGHGGRDIGAQVASVKEKELALKVAFLAKRYLINLGYKVILTRGRDVFIPLKKRASIANSTKSKLFVSFHFNAHKNVTVSGIEIYYYRKGTKWRTSHSKKVAESVLTKLLSYTKASSRGVKHGNFHVIRETKMPAILVEGGFLTHQEERNQLKNAKYIDQIARAVADGIDKYFNS